MTRWRLWTISWPVSCKPAARSRAEWRVQGGAQQAPLPQGGFIPPAAGEIKRAPDGIKSRREMGGTEVSKVDDALAAVDDFVAGKL